MKFESKKGLGATILIYSVVTLLVTLFINDLLNKQEFPIFIHLFNLLVIIFLQWMFLGTFYSIKDGILHYRSGPIFGKIEVDKIQEVIVGTTLWAGLKPATSSNGIIVKYNKFDEIYLSPKHKTLFIEELHRFNPEIDVIH